MNKIYKVVWSKAKHCYVVTSELAKRQTKGCGARGLRMATVSLGVAASLLCAGAVLPIFGESVAEAAVTVSDASSPLNNVTPAGSIAYDSYTTALLEFNVYTIKGSVTTDKALSITGSSNDTESAKNGFIGIFNYSDNVTGSGASLSNGTVGALIGGGTITANAESNAVTVAGGTVDIGMYGGFSYSGKATGNSIEISGDSTVINSNVVNGNYDYSKVVGGSGKTGASKNTVTIKGGTINSTVYGGYSEDGVSGGSTAAEGNKVNITGGKINFLVYGGFSNNSNANFNAVTVSGGEFSTVFSSVYGGFSSQGNATNNSVSVSGGSLNDVCGGSGNGNADNNTVTVTGGTMMSVNGGRSVNGTANNNTIDISGGTIGSSDEGGSVVGAYHAGGGAATANNNKINIYKNANIIGNVAGAKDNYGYALASGNTITIDGSAVVTGNVAGVSGWGAEKKENKVFIKNGSVTGDVYGGLLDYTAKYKGSLIKNEVNISDGKVTGNIYGGAVKGKVIGDVKENKVNITGGKLETITKIDTQTNPATITVYRSDVYGGYLEGDGNSGVVQDNTVTISGGDLSDSKVYGGYGNSSNAVHNTVEFTKEFTAPEKNFITVAGGASGSGNAIKNVVTIGGGNIGRYDYNVYGGYSETGTAGGTADEGNTVTITGGKVGGSAVGGFSKSGAVKNNVATVSGSETEVANLRGGGSSTGTVSENTANIQGGTVNYAYGGFSSDGTANGNTLNIGGGKVGGGVYGGDADTVTYNAVTISGDAKISTPYLIGGRSYNYPTGGVATGNTFTISGGTFSGVAEYSYAIIGGFTDQNGTAKDNAVNLTGEVTGLENFELYGYENAVTHSGNELHIGGTKTYDSKGTATVSDGAVWQGKSSDGTVTNTVESISNFETIVLHNVAWSTTIPVLEATTVKNVGTLDIKNLKFDKTPSSGESMALLKSASDLSAITLTYSGGTTPITADGVVIKGGSGEQTEETGVNGVKLTTKGGSEKVLLPDKNTIAYSFEAGTVKGITFGTFDISKDARNLSSSKFEEGNTVDAKDLKFADTAILLSVNDSVTLVSNASGMATAVANNTGKTVAIKDYEDAQKIKYSATATGDVTSDGAAVKYTVNSVEVNSIELAGWKGTTSSVPTGWALANKATVNTKDMTEPTAATTIITSGTDDFFKAAKISGGKEYKETDFSEEDSGITFAGKQEKGVKAEGKNLVYALGSKNVATVTMSGDVAWNSSEAHYTNEKYTFTDSSETDISTVKFTATVDPLNQSMTLIKAKDAAYAVKGTVTEATPEFTVNLSNTSLSATAKGEAKVAEGNLTYKVTDVELQSVTVNGVGSTSDTVPNGWTAASGLTVDTSKMELPGVMPAAGEEVTILKGSDKITFGGASFSGDNAYGKNPDRFTEEDKTQGAVIIAGKQDKGVAAGADGKSLVYKVGTKDVSSISLGTVTWKEGATLLDASDENVYNFANAKLEGSFAMNYEKPEEVAAKQSMTLLKANATLKDMAEQTKATSYSYEPVSGVTVDAAVTGALAAKDGAVTFTVAENRASKLTFGDVEWKTGGALVTRPANITFAGAAVDTTKINFTNMIYLDANQQMTLVSDFGDSVGTITGSKYMVGTAFEGEGEASLSGSNLIFTTKTEAGLSEQTHKTVMAMDAGLAMLQTGSEFVDKTVGGLADKKNAGNDGVSTFASVGGGASRYSTGSHVNTHTWNAIVAVGKTNETKKGTIEYGVFGEYGKGSYKLYSDAGNGDGDAHYAGGGLLAKWTNKHDVYAEASIRAGRMSDSSSDIMQDGLGNRYGYNVHANYYGTHVGVGKVFNYKGGKNLDVYGKFFYTKRDGVEYDAPQHYDLDSVASSVLRIGARYGTTDKKWNWYGGLAYEYEFDGEAKGTVNGKEIRAASIKGSSVRGEFGMKMSATKDNPWQADISIYGYGGKHRGFGGNVSVAYTF